jgi:hypothetical protein
MYLTGSVRKRCNEKKTIATIQIQYNIATIQIQYNMGITENPCSWAQVFAHNCGAPDHGCALEKI